MKGEQKIIPHLIWLQALYDGLVGRGQLLDLGLAACLRF